MKDTIARFENFVWYDVTNPTPEELEGFEEEFRIPGNLLLDYLDPVKLPKLEKIGSIQFYLFRIFDRASDPAADIAETLTRKIAAFVGPGFLLTIHRMPREQLAALAEKVLPQISEVDTTGLAPNSVLFKLFEEGVRTFYTPLEKIEDGLECVENDIFSRDFDAVHLQNIQLYRRQLSIIKRLSAHSQDLVARSAIQTDTEKILAGDLKETLAHLLFLSDELLEDTDSLLSLQISMASQKTNDVVRVLTIFSVFFMPLTFIVGVYGMNFKYMPELEYHYGYELVWVLMFVVTGLIAYWFKRRGWLKFR